MSTNDIFDGKTILRVPDLARFFGVREHTIYKWKATGQIPKPLKIGGEKSLRWLSSDLENFLRERAGG